MVMAAIQTISAQSQNFKLGQWSEIKNSIIKELNLSYVDSLPIDRIMRAGVDAMLEELDPYTIYIPEEENEEPVEFKSRAGQQLTIVAVDVLSANPNLLRSSAADKHQQPYLFTCRSLPASDTGLSRLSGFASTTPMLVVRLRVANRGASCDNGSQLVSMPCIPYHLPPHCARSHNLFFFCFSAPARRRSF